jgi:poly(3-hydroxybutyrate) depolymerase
MLYQAYQLQSDLMSPMRLVAQHLGSSLWLEKTEKTVMRKVAAAAEVISRLRLTHARPPYNIHSVVVGDRECEVVEETVLTLPFGSLIRFRKTDTSLPPQPAVLLAAPLSGHFATLLRETARTLLQDHEVFITDWHNARDVSLRHGGFSLDDYISYLMRFTEAVGPGCHMVAVCQPCVAALAATALMAEDDNPAQPRSLTLMAGPVGKPIEWFEKNLISHVPLPHAGFMRRVYPGFVQLSAFMSMNPERHKQQFRAMFDHLNEGRVEEAATIQNFYEEYLAVNDLPAEFYLETVEKVFQTYDLPRGVLTWKDRTVNTAAIRRTALMTVEGERDDICAVGQTVAAQDLCSSVRPYLKTHHVQTGVGHYGVFSGRKWNQQIYPRVRDMIHSTT